MTFHKRPELNSEPEYRGSVRLHLTNVAGIGAVQVVGSLLPALETCPGFRTQEIYLPGKGDLAGYQRTSPGSEPIHYRRFVPNALSRSLECTVFGYRFSGKTPLVVLGDIPIRCQTKQVVLLHNPHLLENLKSGSIVFRAKYHSARLLFRANLKYAAAIVVQSDVMKGALESAYPEVCGRVRVISQPAPNWLLSSKLRRVGRLMSGGSKLSLMYPAAYYPYKNHGLLQKIAQPLESDCAVERLTLTISGEQNPNPGLSWIDCVGILPTQRILEYYKSIDALVFLSKSESLGLPLIEAMSVGLPIVCSDLPYARSLCGDMAIYFDPDDVHSFSAAVLDLRNRLRQGWWPDWSRRVQLLPSSWQMVAQRMLELTI